MAKTRKRGNESKREARPGAERVAELRAQLEVLEPEGLDSVEFEAVVEAVTREEAEAALVALAALEALAGADKGRLKALRRGAHRLRERGIEVPELGQVERTGVRIAPERGSDGGLPVLLAPPSINGERRITFGLSRGSGVILVEAVFKAQELFRLVGAPSNRASYRRWAKQMCEPRGAALPERVTLSAAWLERKLWEIGQRGAQGELGKEVDESLLAALRLPDGMPPHPAFERDWSGATALDFAALLERPERLFGLYSGSALGALRQQWYELGGDPDIEPGSEAAAALRADMRAPVADWVEQWGMPKIVELLLDSALFFEACGDRDAGRSFCEVARVDERGAGARDERVRELLLDYALWQLGR